MIRNPNLNHLENIYQPKYCSPTPDTCTQLFLSDVLPSISVGFRRGHEWTQLETAWTRWTVSAMRARCTSAQSKACLELGPKSTATRRSRPRRRSPVSRSSSGAASCTTGMSRGSTTSLQLYSSTSSSTVSIASIAADEISGAPTPLISVSFLATSLWVVGTNYEALFRGGFATCLVIALKLLTPGRSDQPP